MSRIKFPKERESNHPHYLWNENEFIIRCLSQNRIGLSCNENNSSVIITALPIISTQLVAHGGAEFPIVPIQFETNTNSTKWIYQNPITGSLFSSNTRPTYNQYLHAWYNSQSERAIAFIDVELPAGQRCLLMDSINAMYDYDHRIPMVGGDLVNEYRSGGTYTITLDRGLYRFHLCGGKGGNGGNISKNGTFRISGIDYSYNFQANGGAGVYADVTYFRLRILRRTQLSIKVGYDGNNGDDANIEIAWDGKTGPAGGNGTINNPSLGYSDPFANVSVIATSGGGAASGQDTVLMTAEGNRLQISIGGAGGGGALFYSGVPPSQGTVLFAQGTSSGAGGGGAGAGQAGDGEACYLPKTAVAMQQGSNHLTSTALGALGKGGNINSGGSGTRGSTAGGVVYREKINNILSVDANNGAISGSAFTGKSGETFGTDNFRKGGNSPGIDVSTIVFDRYAIWGIGSGYFILPWAKVETALGGNSLKTSTSGYLQIYKTGSIPE